MLFAFTSDFLDYNMDTQVSQDTLGTNQGTSNDQGTLPVGQVVTQGPPPHAHTSSEQGTPPYDITLAGLHSSMATMASVMQDMGKAFSNLAGKREKDPEDSDDETEPPVCKKANTSTLDDLEDLFGDAASTDGLQDDILDSIEDVFAQNEETGPEIKENLAKKVNERFLVNLNVEKIIEKEKMYLRPNNCPNLIVPKCNDEIWHHLNKGQRSGDIKLANIQRAIASSATAMIQIVEGLLASAKSGKAPETHALVGKACDALALLGHASQDISFRRREAIKPSLKKEYGGLMSRNVPVTSKLFGDDVLKTMKDLKQESYISREAANISGPKNEKRSGFGPHKKSWSSKKYVDKTRRPHQFNNPKRMF